MPILHSGTFTLTGYRLDSTTWFYDPSPPQNYYNTIVGPAVPAQFVTTGPTVLQTSADGTGLDPASPPAGFTPTTGIVATPGLAGVAAPGSGPSHGTIQFVNTGFLTSAEGTPYSGVITDFPSYITLLDFCRITITSHGSGDSPNIFSVAAFGSVAGETSSATKIDGAYDIVAWWYTIPAVDACGEPHTSQLQLSTTNPGPPWVPLDPDESDAAPTPVVRTVIPNSGPPAGGTAITISGEGFGDGATVMVGLFAATSVVVVDQFTITCVTPGGSLGTVDVVVTNVDGVSSS